MYVVWTSPPGWNMAKVNDQGKRVSPSGVPMPKVTVVNGGKMFAYEKQFEPFG